MTKKNILLIIPNLDFGGAQVSFMKLNAMLSTYHNVLAVVFNKDNMAPFPLADKVVELGVKGGSSVWRKVLNFRLRIVRLRRLKQAHRIDVSISFLEGADYVNILSRTSDRVVVSVRGSKRNDQNIAGPIGWLRHYLLMPFLYKRAHAVVAVNEGIRNELVNHYGIRNVTVIPNGYNVNEIRTRATEVIDDAQVATYLSRHKVIALAGRLAPEKGFHLFMPVFAALKMQYPALRLLVVGDGPWKNEIEKAISKAGLTCSGTPTADSDVLLAGYQENPHKFISKAQLFVLPSLHEGFPNALVEAMAVGVPVAAANCPYGPAEILGGGGQEPCGLLLPVLNEPDAQQAWVRQLEVLVKDLYMQQVYVSAASRKMLEYGEEKVLRRWLDLIDRL
ncbi:MAG: glycosyltransferase [Bacteroidia bacterium]|nr:glycosyltransferase [Bacteroidia bacterium]